MLTDIEFEKCANILKTLFDEPNSEAFRVPVDWEAWGLTDYLTIVKKPMDLGTIDKKLKKKQYKTVASFIADVDLVWANCKSYNQDGSDLYVVAEELRQQFHELLQGADLSEELVQADKGDVLEDNDALAPTVKEKTSFSKNVYDLSGENLGKIIQMLEDNCPHCLDKTSSDVVEINIDSIDGKTFRQVSEFVVNSMPKKEKNNSDDTIISQSVRKGKNKKIEGDSDDSSRTKRSKH